MDRHVEPGLGQLQTDGPPVTRATPLAGCGAGVLVSVNPTELERIESRDDGDEAEDDAESQHGMLLLSAFD